MKRYCLVTILMGNCALGMWLPDLNLIGMNQEQLLKLRQDLTINGHIDPMFQKQIDARLANLTQIEREAAQVEITQLEQALPAPTAAAEVKTTISRIARPTQLRPEDVPAPFSPEDFEDVEPGENSQAAVPADDAPIGVGAVPGPVSSRKDSLARTQMQLPSFSPEEPKEAISPAATPAIESGSHSGEESPGSSTIKKSARTTLPVIEQEPIAGSDGKAYGAPSDKPASVEQGRGASWKEVKETLPVEEDQTPGGPDSPSTEISKSKDPLLESGKSSSSIHQNDQWGTAQKTLIAAAVVAAAYGSTELILAYKSIPEHEWKHTSGILKKAKLVLGKTWENIKKRPSQVTHVLKKSTNSVFEKLKS